MRLRVTSIFNTSVKSPKTANSSPIVQLMRQWPVVMSMYPSDAGDGRKKSCPDQNKTGLCN